jgi:hypothetical protein
MATTCEPLFEEMIPIAREILNSLGDTLVYSPSISDRVEALGGLAQQHYDRCTRASHAHDNHAASVAAVHMLSCCIEIATVVLPLACEQNKPQTVSKLLRLGIPCEDIAGHLRHALASGWLETAEVLAPVLPDSPRGILHAMAATRNVSAALWLLQKLPDFSADSHGDTALDIVCRDRDHGVGFFTTHGEMSMWPQSCADIAAAMVAARWPPENVSTNFVAAVQADDLSRMDVLFPGITGAAGGDGNTPLHVACAAGHVAATVWLLQRTPADLAVVNASGATHLDVAFARRHYHLLPLLSLSNAPARAEQPCFRECDICLFDYN